MRTRWIGSTKSARPLDRKSLGGLATTLALVAASNLGGCRQIGGIEDPIPRTEAPAQTKAACGSLSSAAVDACNSCLTESCCETAASCTAVPDCAPLVPCLAACVPADVACLDRCAGTARGATSTASEALLTCARQSCGTTCLSCGSIPLELRTGHGPLVPRDDPACRSCASEKCCATTSACAAERECLALLACHDACYPDTTCHADCDEAHPSGTALYAQVESCLQTQCGPSCPNPAPRWECVGKFQYPAARKPSVAFGGQVVDQVSLTEPVPGITVTAYATQDVTLQKPLAAGKADASGFVQVPNLPVTATILSTAVTGFEGFFGLEGPGRMTTYFYVNKPIYDDAVDYLMPMLTPGTAAALAQLSDVKLDPEKGIVLAFMKDCQVQPAPGVAYSIEHSIPGNGAGIEQFYVISLSPSRTAQETDPYAVGGFTNVPPGPFTLTARERATGKEIARVLAYSRKNSVAWLHLEPSTLRP